LAGRFRIKAIDNQEKSNTQKAMDIFIHLRPLWVDLNLNLDRIEHPLHRSFTRLVHLAMAVQGPTREDIRSGSKTLTE